MKKFFVYSLMTVLVILATDRIVGWGLERVLLNQKSNLIFELKYKLHDARPEVVILGSSRTNHHYNDLEMQKESHLTTLNYGMDGTDLFMDFVFLSQLLSRNDSLPKVVIVDLKQQELEMPLAYSYITTLYPFCNEVKAVKENCTRYTKYERLKLLSSTYKYNNYLFTLFSGLNKSKSGSVSGFRPITMPGYKLENKELQAKKLNNEALEELSKIVSLCESKKVRLVFAMSPVYATGIQELPTYKYMQKFCKEKGLVFLDFSNYAELTSPNFYVDYNHLNGQGAKRFSSIFLQNLKAKGIIN